MVYRADDFCTCNHAPDSHVNETGRCEAVNTTHACKCRRYRSWAQKREQEKEEKYWARIGGY